MLNTYEINPETLLIIPIDNTTSKVVETKKNYLVSLNTMDIIERSCKYFGSSYLGRKEGTKSLLGINYKTPIIIEETRNMIFFPTNSPRLHLSTWISLNGIESYKKKRGNASILMKNGKNLDLPISFGSFQNQIFRATRLESVLRKRLES